VEISASGPLRLTLDGFRDPRKFFSSIDCRHVLKLLAFAGTHIFLKMRAYYSGFRLLA
jgi:hypothetical protein